MSKDPKPDMVNHPPHYQSENGIECIECIRGALGRDGFIAFLRGQIIKYTWRSASKGSMLEDQQKCNWYEQKLLQVLSETFQEKRDARLQGYEGTACPVCTNFTLVRSDTIWKCECGADGAIVDNEWRVCNAGTAKTP